MGSAVKHKKPARRTVTIDLPQLIPKAVFVRSVLVTHLSAIK